jgi:hypothetical protein
MPSYAGKIGYRGERSLLGVLRRWPRLSGDLRVARRLVDGRATRVRGIGIPGCTCRRRRRGAPKVLRDRKLRSPQDGGSRLKPAEFRVIPKNATSGYARAPATSRHIPTHATHSHGDVPFPSTCFARHQPGPAVTELPSATHQPLTCQGAYGAGAYAVAYTDITSIGRGTDRIFRRGRPNVFNAGIRKWCLNRSESDDR